MGKKHMANGGVQEVTGCADSPYTLKDHSVG